MAERYQSTCRGPELDWEEAIQLAKDFTAERSCNEVEFYMCMIVDDQQTFDGLINNLKNAFQSGETVSELISNFYSWHERKNESEDIFAEDLQIHIRKNIPFKPFLGQRLISS